MDTIIVPTICKGTAMGCKLERFGTDIWVMAGDDVRMYGVLPFTTRMTIIRLGDGKLWIHSPVTPTPERCHIVDELGPVGYLVAPNKIHSLGIQPWQSIYPEAQTWVSPGFSRRHPTIPTHQLLSNQALTPWTEEIDHIAVEGHAVLDEVVFLHRASKSLIITDLIQRHDPKLDRWPWRNIKKIAGISGPHGGVPLDIKLSISNKSAFRQSIDTIVSWDFDNLIISHGHCRKTGAKADLVNVFSWLS